MTDIAQVEPLVQRLLKWSQEKGMTGAEVHIALDQGLTVNVRMGETESVEHALEKSAEIKVYKGKHSGITSTSEFTSSSFQKALKRLATLPNSRMRILMWAC
jgi:PmbA protein